MMRQHIGHALRAIREERGMTQKTLAELAGVAHQTVSNLERGKKGSLDLADQLSGALGCEAAQLLERAARFAKH